MNATAELTSYLDNPMYRPNDTRLYWVTRNGRSAKRYWSELTRQEKLWTIEAEQRAAYDAMFNPCGF